MIEEEITEELLQRSLADDNCDLDGFTDLIHDLLNRVWGPNWGIFTSESPTGNDPEVSPTPHITYNLLRREPADKKSLKRKQFKTFADKDNPGHNITLYRQWFDCAMEFVVYTKTNKEATRVAQRFEEFMETYTGYFKQKGVSEIVFNSEEGPSVSSESRQDIPHRTVRYFVRIERITPVRSIHLKQIDIIIDDDEPQLAVLPDTVSYGEETNDELENQTVESQQTDQDEFLGLYKQHFPK